jgi:hypothetical protein
MSQRRRRRRENRKPLSKKSIVTAGVGFLSLVAFAFLIQYSYINGGKVSKMLAGAAVMTLLLPLLALCEGIRGLRDTEFSFLSRLAGVLCPFVAEAAWVVLYVVGYLV